MNGNGLVSVFGTVVADAEEVKTGGGSLVKFRVAFNKKRKGENIATFTKWESWSEYRNEHILKYFKKGKNVHVRGTFIQDDYEDKNGNKVQNYRNILEDFDLLDNRNEKPQEKMDEGPGF